MLVNLLPKRLATSVNTHSLKPEVPGSNPRLLYTNSYIEKLVEKPINQYFKEVFLTLST